MTTEAPPQRLFKSAANRLSELAKSHNHGEEFKENFTKRELKSLRGYDLHYGDVISMLQQLTDRKQVIIVHVELVRRIGGPGFIDQERITMVAKRA